MKWFERVTICVLLFLLVISAAEEVMAAQELTVSAALSLKSSFEEIGREYEKKTSVKVNFNFGPSGALQKQIENGAPVDLFASASPKEMNSLESGGFIIPATRSDFCGNALVLIAAADARRPVFSFGDLSKQEIKRIAIGNPSTVPAGKYSEETLRSMGLWDALKNKLIYAEHVRQVMDYVVRGEADAGIVFLTDAMLRSKELRIVSEAPSANHKPVVYTMAVIRGTQRNTYAREFIAMVLSKEGMAILRKNGFKAAR